MAKQIFNYLSTPEDISYEWENAAGNKVKVTAFSKAKIKSLMFGLSPQEIVEKIMFKAMEGFLKKYFKDAFLK